MIYGLVISFVINVLFFAAFIVIIQEYRKLNINLNELKNLTLEEIEDKYKDETEKIKQFYDLKKKESQKDFQNEINQFAIDSQNKINNINNQIDFLEQKLNSKKQEYNNLLIHQEELLKKDLKIFEDEERRKINSTLNSDIAQKNLDFQKFSEEMNERRENLTKEIAEIENKVKEFRDVQKAINESERIKNLKKEEKNKYRILLTEEEKSDILFLDSIMPSIKNKQILNKLIWSEYLMPHFQQMIKNIFGDKIPKNVIYCIQNINTNEKYIGKTTTEVSKRWTEHIKTSLNIGTVSRNKIHDGLYLHWDEFTFTILEQVNKDDINQREKFYIDLYQSNIYGYNIKSGG